MISRIWIEIKIRALLLLFHWQARKMVRASIQDAREFVVRWRFHEKEFPLDISNFIEKDIQMVEASLK